MPFTVVSLGGPVAPEGEAILRAAGIVSLATDPYPGKAELLPFLTEVQPDALIVRLIERVDAEVMTASPKLKAVAKHGAGTNDIDVAAAARLGIPVLAAVGANAHSVAEHALTLLLALVKDLPAQDAFVRGGGWEKKAYRGHEIRGRTLGIVGLGAIGSVVARLAAAFGMTVIAYDPYIPDAAFDPYAERVSDLNALLARADVVSLHCPLTAETRGMIDGRALGLMKRDALLINTARGEVVDEPALVAALKDGTIAAAGLDVFAPEPPAAANPLWALPNVIVSPHVGGVTEEARRELSVMTCRNVVALLEGREIDGRFLVRPA
ncbi:hydroxyacid dehydrogenase [Pleomorphomonas koreensis]|uniref:hydroxyacid dehydrogenase n=1 Tax=Pleomorphomonas koreensis TaxID=257440 RepID=UPI0003FC2EE9|nr:hydroxyacid dehydrogenase [Pleomorphomonas koreensis]